MRFTVTWTAAAKAELAELWLRLPPDERQEFTVRVDWIDRALRDNAHQKGASVSSDHPLRFRAPPEFFEVPTVGVVYSVSKDDRIVEVLELHVVLRRP